MYIPVVYTLVINGLYMLCTDIIELHNNYVTGPIKIDHLSARNCSLCSINS